MKRIAILLATYNGGSRLSVLLNSLQQQTYHDWTLYIHDDGSTDDTLDVCGTFMSTDSRIVLLHDTVAHRGAKKSFIWLLENTHADYYMFCDQDDLWLPSKIEQSFNHIRKQEILYPNSPICVHTDLAVCDKHYNVVANSLWKLSKTNPRVLETIGYLQVFNCVTGCTMIFNKKAKDAAFPFEDVAPMHDFWVAYQTLLKNGHLTHLNISTILYCQHENNVVGANSVGYAYLLDKMGNAGQVVRRNIANYRIMHNISGISAWHYFKYKVMYEIRRFF